MSLPSRLGPFLLTLAGCVSFQPGLDGSGRVVTEPRHVTGFDQIDIEDSFDVEITVGPAYDVRIAGDDNLLPYVRTEVRGRTLHVEETREFDPTDDIRITISTPELTGLSSSGSSDVRATGVRASGFDASVSGSGRLVADGDFGDLSASVSGSEALLMRGTADDIDAGISGSGDLDLGQVAARSAAVRVSGSGDAVVRVGETLQANVSGSGGVRYHGSPRVESSVSGSGSVRPASSR